MGRQLADGEACASDRLQWRWGWCKGRWEEAQPCHVLKHVNSLSCVTCYEPQSRVKSCSPPDPFCLVRRSFPFLAGTFHPGAQSLQPLALQPLASCAGRAVRKRWAGGWSQHPGDPVQGRCPPQPAVSEGPVWCHESRLSPGLTRLTVSAVSWPDACGIRMRGYLVMVTDWSSSFRFVHFRDGAMMPTLSFQ